MKRFREDKSILEYVKKIRELYKAIIKTSSDYPENDYSKKIVRMKKELKEYCFYKKYNYKEVAFEFNI